MSYKRGEQEAGVTGKRERVTPEGERTEDAGRTKDGMGGQNRPMRSGRARRRRLQWRMRIVAATVSLLIAALGYRVYSIQVTDGPIYEAMARSQQRIALSGVDSRGTICDRSGQPLTGARLEYVYILPRARLDERGEALVNRLVRFGGRERRTTNETYRIFTAEHYSKDVSERLRKEYGAYILMLPQRYERDQTAVYLLGYVRDSDGVGVAGLERAFDDWLSRRDKAVYGVADAANLILPGFEIQNSDRRNVRLITTLDRTLQQKTERIARNVTEGRCCIIVTEVASGDILACATAPGFDPLQVEELLESQNRELLDIALQGQYPPGSVFKLVVAAAALESGICTPEQEFVCTGVRQIGDVSIRCTSQQGHGTLTMEEAFSSSCNCAFIQMGQLVGADRILEMARALGLGSQVLEGLDMDQAGNLTTAEEAAGAGILNLAIGQGTLLVTPLQAARMTQTIANGGLFTGLYLADRLEDDGQTKTILRTESRRVMREDVADAILAMMRRTTVSGTACSLVNWDCGGKTGSAEGVLNGERTVHAWFCGVVPSAEPRFSVTVFVEGGGFGGTTAAPVFEAVLETLELETAESDAAESDSE